MRFIQRACACLVCLLLFACQSAEPESIPTPSTPTRLPDTSIPATVAPTASLPPPTLTPYVAAFDIYPDRPLQTIAHIGSGNFIHFFGGSTLATEPISEFNLATLQPRFARLSIELDAWEPVNDNADPYDLDRLALMDDAHNHATFDLMKQLQAQGVELTASVWRVPDWLVEDASMQTGQIIPRALYPEAIEAIASWLLHAKNAYGVEVAFFSFNEANLGINVLLTPEDYSEFIRQAGPRFAALGLKTRFLLADCSAINGCLEYAQGIYAAQDIRPYLGPLAFHNWDGISVGDDTIRALGEWADAQGLEVRCTEGGWDAQLWRRSQEFPSWINARQLMYSYTRTLKLSRAVAFYYWEMMGGDYSLNDGQQAYPALDLLSQLNTAFPPGTQIIETSDDQGAIALVAGLQPNGKLIVQIVNNSIPENLLLRGLPDGAYDMIVSNAKGLRQRLQTIQVSNSAARFEAPAFSVILLTPP